MCYFFMCVAYVEDMLYTIYDRKVWYEEVFIVNFYYIYIHI